MAKITRRDLIKQAAAVAAAAPLAHVETRMAAQDQPAALTPPPVEQFFPADFSHTKVQTSGATINAVKGGDGPPLLLLHGAPETHIAWRLVAPRLAKQYTLIVPDLRGYGDSSKPADLPDHANYRSKVRARALHEEADLAPAIARRLRCITPCAGSVHAPATRRQRAAELADLLGQPSESAPQSAHRDYARQRLEPRTASGCSSRVR